MFSPHVPPPSSSIRLHHLWQRLQVFFIAAVIALLGGISGAAALLAWGVFTPNITGNVWRFSNGANARRFILEDDVRRTLSRQLFRVYYTVETNGGVQILNPSNSLGEAALVSSDGWAVAYGPHFDGKISSWVAVGSDNVLRNVERALADRRSGLLFIKIGKPTQKNDWNTGEVWPVATFANDISPLDTVFVGTAEGWLPSMVQAFVASAAVTPHLDSAPILQASIQGAFPQGAPVITPEGRLVGMVTSGNKVMPLKMVADLLPSILKNGKVTYATLGTEGWFGSEQPLFINGVSVDGFIVSRVVNKQSPLKRGDVIREVNGREIFSDIVGASAPGSILKLRIWRQGRMLDISAPVFTTQ